MLINFDGNYIDFEQSFGIKHTTYPREGEKSGEFD